MSSRTERAAEAALDLALSLMGASEAADRVYKTDRDYATATDYAIEDGVRYLLAVETPELGFLGEERGHTGNRETYWCLDPVDGTTNYTRGLPNYGVSLALVDRETPVFGAIALPAHQERYMTSDRVAQLNGQAISVADTSSLSEAIISFGDFATGPGSEAKNRRRLAMVGQLAATVGRVRMLGSAATDLAWLAAGRLDAVVIDANHLWDLAAGVALVQAAGATVTHIDGTAYAIAGPDLLAAVPQVHEQLVATLGR